MKPERVQWKRTKGRNQLLLDKVYDAVTEEFSRDAMASLATVLAHIASSPMSQSRRPLRLLATSMRKLATCFRGAVLMPLY